MADDRWMLDLQILEAAAQLEEGDDPHPGWREISAVTGLVEKTVKGSLSRLQGTYLDFKAMPGDGDPLLAVRDIRLLPAGRQAIHQWPQPEDAIAALVAALGAAADEAAEPEEADRLRRAAAGLAGLGRDVAASVMAAYLARVGGIA